MLSEEQEKVLRQLWLQGVSASSIAKRLGLSENEVYIYARILGLPQRTGANPAKKITREVIEQVRVMRMDGATITEIAEYFDIHPRTVSDILKVLGLTKSRPRSSVVIPERKLRAMVEAGFSDQQIARIFGCTVFRVRSLRYRYGINRKEVAERKRLEKIRYMANAIVKGINSKGFATSTELGDFKIRFDKKILYALEEEIEGLRYFRILYTSTSKYSVFPPKFRMWIFYVEGSEEAVANFLFENINRDLLKNKEYRNVALPLRAVLRNNSVPKKIENLVLEKVKRFFSRRNIGRLYAY